MEFGTTAEGDQDDTGSCVAWRYDSTYRFAWDKVGNDQDSVAIAHNHEDIHGKNCEIRRHIAFGKEFVARILFILPSGPFRSLPCWPLWKMTKTNLRLFWMESIDTNDCDSYPQALVERPHFHSPERPRNGHRFFHSCLLIEDSDLINFIARHGHHLVAKPINDLCWQRHRIQKGPKDFRITGSNEGRIHFKVFRIGIFGRIR